MERKKLLILTQKVDKNDLALGFFHRWVEEFGKNFQNVEVMALSVGEYDLPGNVRVYSLGKNPDPNFQGNTTIYGSKVWKRILYGTRFLRLIWRLRNNYDTVFVHMNEEYLLLGGLLWWLMGKKIVFWRNHKMGSWRTRLAVWFSSTVCHTSPEAFVASYKKAIRMPVGIDTEFFTPTQELTASDSVLFLARIDPVKKVEVFVEALKLVRHPLHASLYGSPTEPSSTYALNIASMASSLLEKGLLKTYPGVAYTKTRELYRSHSIFVNLTPSGSFDKTIGEAMACGSLVVCANTAVKDILPTELFVTDINPEKVARALDSALLMEPSIRINLSRELRKYVEREHSLSLLMKQLCNLPELPSK